MGEKSCGCYAIQDVKDGLKPNPYAIVFCKLHAHAGELRRALQEHHKVIKATIVHTTCNVCELLAKTQEAK